MIDITTFKIYSVRQYTPFITNSLSLRQRKNEKVLNNALLGQETAVLHHDVVRCEGVCRHVR